MDRRNNIKTAIYVDRQTERQTDWLVGWQTGWLSGRQANRQTHERSRWTYIHIQADIQTAGGMDRYTEGHMDRRTNGQREDRWTNILTDGRLVRFVQGNLAEGEG
jgi:hypothetical protein